MGINIDRYVDITSVFPTRDDGNLAFSGLVFTEKTPLVTDPTDGTLIKYNNGSIIRLSLNECEKFFGANSDEYKFARGYYNYMSPENTFASILKFKKVIEASSVDSFIAASQQKETFGSFTFLSGGDKAKEIGGSSAVPPKYPELVPVIQVAEENALMNGRYLFVANLRRGTMDVTEYSEQYVALFDEYAGTHIMDGKYLHSAYMPMAIFSSVDYENGTVANFMFRQFDDDEAVVLDDDTYYKYNKAKVNFYGLTQSNGQQIGFYQRGFNIDGTDTSIYCNEVWFKAKSEYMLIKYQIEHNRISADTAGVDTVKTELLDVCSAAVRNRAFMPKETISRSDMKEMNEIVLRSGGTSDNISSITSDLTAKGYSIYAYLAGPIAPDATYGDRIGASAEYIIVYYVFYGTADSVRFIKGNDIMVK